MTRYRSRQAETEDVNERRLRRGAVSRQHIQRWAVGATELAPGIVGDIHLHPTTLETIREVGGAAGQGRLLVLSATGQSFASGGGYFDADQIVYQHAFSATVDAGDDVRWPVDAVGVIQVEVVWDSYEGGGTIEVEVDGVVPAWGVIGSGTSGQVGCGRRSVHIAEGSDVKIKVTQTSGSAQTGDVLVELSIPDPSVNVTPPPPPPLIELGPRVWYRAEELSLTDGAPVATWTDISGNDFHAQQADSAKRPTFRAGVLNGKAVVEFDGTSDAMLCSGVSLPTAAREWTAFAVFLTDNASAQQMIFNGDDQTNDPGFGRASQYLVIEGGELACVPEGAFLESSGESVTAATWYVGEAIRDPASAEALLDGVGDGATSTALVLPESSPGFYLGWHPAAAGFALLDGKVAEIIGWDRKLTADERTFVRSYFNTEYSV